MASPAPSISSCLAPEEIVRFVRRIVEAVDPIEVIAFGSRARGNHRQDSDLDLAVIVQDDEDRDRRILWGVKEHLRLPLDLLTISKQRYDRFRPWINTIERQIDREGVRLYERGGKPPDRSTLERLC